MYNNRITPEARKALNEFKIEVAEELNGMDTHLYDLKANLSRSELVTDQLVETKEKSRANPNNSFSDYLGKGF